MSEQVFNYHDFFELSPDLLIISTYDGQYKEVNAATLKTFGYTKEALFSKPINHYIHPEDQEITTSIRDQIRNHKTIFHFENRYLTKDGDIIWLEWTSKASKKEKLIYSVAKEISFKKAVELERNILINELKDKNQSYKELSYTTSHDLRSPVDNIISILKLIDKTTIEDKDNINLIAMLEKGSQQLKSKLNNYIDNLGSNQSVNVSIEEVNFQESLKTVSNNINNLISSSKASISSDFSAAQKIRFNREYMNSIFLNLLSNSIKYAKPSSPPKITIWTEKSGNKVKLHFKDNGIGIDLNKSKGKIFGLHQTFHDNKNSKGIGLYLVHTHITSFGGKIEVDSEVDIGTTFKLTFNEILG